MKIIILSASMFIIIIIIIILKHITLLFGYHMLNCKLVSDADRYLCEVATYLFLNYSFSLHHC